MDDLYQLSFEAILDYLEELGKQLDIGKNGYMQEACELSYATAPATPPIVRAFYDHMPAMFDRERIRRTVEFNIGIPYLEGWVERARADRDSLCTAFGFQALDFGPLPGLVVDGRAYVVVHPLWGNHSNRKNNVLARARSEASATGLEVHTLDSFNLRARPAWARFNLLGRI